MRIVPRMEIQTATAIVLTRPSAEAAASDRAASIMTQAFGPQFR